MVPQEIHRKSCEGVLTISSCRFSVGYRLVFQTEAAMLWFVSIVSVVYSEEVVLVGEGLIFLEIVGGTCTVSLFPVLLAVWVRLSQGEYC